MEILDQDLRISIQYITKTHFRKHKMKRKDVKCIEKPME